MSYGKGQWNGRTGGMVPADARGRRRRRHAKTFAIGLLALAGGLVAVTTLRGGTANAKEIPEDDSARIRIVLAEVPSEPLSMAYDPKPGNAPNDDEDLPELAPEVTEHHETVAGHPWGYWLYRARPGARNRPLILSLHGSGECGDDLGALSVSSLSRFILDGSVTPDCDVLMPQCPSFGWDTDALHSLLMKVADDLGSDMGRLSCTGVSMGGFGTWDLLATYPDLFDAAAPVASSGTNFGTGDLDKCKARIRSLVGTADGYDASEAIATVNGGTGGGSAEQVDVPGAGHSDMCAIYGDERYDPVPFLLGEERDADGRAKE